MDITVFTSIVTPNRLLNFVHSRQHSHFTPLISKTSILSSQNSLTDICWHPLAPPLPLPTLPGPSRDLPKNVQSEKWNHKKNFKDSDQNASPGYLLQIQDLQKRAPMDLINFPEGPLGPSWGAPTTFGALPGPS